jgi:hypothetical protein
MSSARSRSAALNCRRLTTASSGKLLPTASEDCPLLVLDTSNAHGSATRRAGGWEFGCCGGGRHDTFGLGGDAAGDGPDHRGTEGASLAGANSMR